MACLIHLPYSTNAANDHHIDQSLSHHQRQNNLCEQPLTYIATPLFKSVFIERGQRYNVLTLAPALKCARLQ